MKKKNFTSFVFYKCHLKEAEHANIDICIVTDFFPSPEFMTKGAEIKLQ